MKYLWLLLTAALILLIFYNSSLPGQESGRLSAWLAGLVTSAAQLLHVALTGDVGHHIRKLAHFCEFVCLSWLMCKTFAAFSVSHNESAGYILFFCLLVAVLNEYIQLAAAGRSSQVTDVLLGFSGAFCMWLGWRIWQWSKI